MNGRDAAELIEPRLLDSFLLHSSKQESYVWTACALLLFIYIYIIVKSNKKKEFVRFVEERDLRPYMSAEKRRFRKNVLRIF